MGKKKKEGEEERSFRPFPSPGRQSKEKGGGKARGKGKIAFLMIPKNGKRSTAQKKKGKKCVFIYCTSSNGHSIS